MLEIFRLIVNSFFMIVTIYLFGLIITKNKNAKTIIAIIYFILALILNIIIFIYFTETTKTIFMCILYFIFLKVSFKISYDKSILLSFIYTILMVIPDLLVTFAAMIITSKEYFYNTFAGGIISNLLVSTTMILLTFILRKPLRKLMNYKITENKKLILMAGLTLITLGIFFYNLIKVFEFNNNILTYLIIIVSLICILGYLFKQRIENEKISKRYDELLDIMKTYESDIEEQRTFIHETRNEFATIRSKLNDNEKNKEIIKYIDSIVGDKVSSNMSKYSKFMYLPGNGLKGFFYYKCTVASKKNIKVKVNISKNIENSFLKDIDTINFKNLVRIIGVFLDNAIEASSVSNNKKMGIEIYLIKDRAEIVISNTFDNDINLEKLGNERYTTKGKKRGHGLLLVKKIVKESDAFEVENKVKDNIYIQSIKIKKYQN